MAELSFSGRDRALIAGLIVWLGAWPTQAQTSPTDLAELSLSELVNVQVIPDDPAAERRWTVGYRFVRREFDGYLRGTEEIDLDRMLQRFPVVPTRITQEAHLVDASYRWSDRVRLTVLVPYIEQSTDHIRRVGDGFNITTRGIGDVLVATVLNLQPHRPGALTLSLGMALPTGSIDQKGDTPRGANTQVPYTMQTGSGTYDFQPALIYSKRSERWTLGIQALGVLRLGRNDRDYSLGNRLLVTGQISARPGRRVEPWLKAVTEVWGKIDGFDTELDPRIAPVADSRLFGGERVDLLVGLRIAVGPRRRAAIEVEGGAPVYQSLNGPQPKRLWEISAGWTSYF